MRWRNPGRSPGGWVTDRSARQKEFGYRVYFVGFGKGIKVRGYRGEKEKGGRTKRGKRKRGRERQ